MTQECVEGGFAFLLMVAKLGKNEGGELFLHHSLDSRSDLLKIFVLDHIIASEGVFQESGIRLHRKSWPDMFGSRLQKREALIVETGKGLTVSGITDHYFGVGLGPVVEERGIDLEFAIQFLSVEQQFASNVLTPIKNGLAGVFF